MAVITQAMLEGVLNPQQDEGTPFTVNYQNQGPAYLDKWLYFIEGKDDCWRAREVNSFLPSNKKKIIFCNSLLAERAPNPIELDLLAALIKHYEVYPWYGANARFLESKPVNEACEFWQKRYLFAKAKQQEVEINLAQQGVSTEDYIILDYARYQSLANQLAINFEYGTDDHSILRSSHPKSLHLENQPLKCEQDFVELEKSIDLAELDELEVDSLTPAAFMLLQRKCPKLFTLHINQTIDQSLKNLLQQAGFTTGKYSSKWDKRANTPKTIVELKGVVINNEQAFVEAVECQTISKHLMNELELSNSYLSDEIDLTPYHLQKITFLDSDFGKRDFSKLRELKSIHIEYCRNHHFDLHFLNNETLEEVIIKESAFNNIHFAQLPNLERCEINYCNHLEMEKLPHLRHLSLKQISNETLNFLAPQLEVLNIESCRNIENYRLSNQDTLREFTLSWCNNLQKIALTDVVNLEKVKIHMSPLHSLNLQGCTQLKQVQIDCAEKLTELDLTNTPNLNNLEISKLSQPLLKHLNHPHLKNLTISGVDDGEVLEMDLANFPELESLDITYCPFKKIKLKNASHLKNLKLYSLSSLQALELKDAKDLTFLTIAYCPLSDLDISACESLRELSLSSIKKLASISLNNPQLNCLSIRDSSIKEIDTKDCASLHTMQISCDNLNSLILPRSLQHFDIRGAKKLAHLNLDECSHLKNFEFDGLKDNTFNLPETLENLQVEHLSFRYLQDAKLPHLRNLTINYNKDDDAITSLDNMENLTNLKIRYCDNLSLLSIDHHKNLENIHVENASKKIVLNHLPSLNQIDIECSGNSWDESKLEEISINDCEKFRFLHLLDYKTLKKLSLSKLATFDKLSLKGNYGNQLAELNITECLNFSSLVLKDFENLKQLDLSKLPQLSLIELKNCPIKHFNVPASVQSLKIVDMDRLQTLEFASDNNLEELILHDDSSLPSVNLSALTKLRRLTIQSQNQLQELDLSCLSNLEELNLCYLDDLKKIDLSCCKHLKILKINGCEQLTDLNLHECTELETVEVRGSTAIGDLNLTPCQHLKKLELHDVNGSINLENLTQLNDLSIFTGDLDLNLQGCSHLKKLALKAEQGVSVSHLEDCKELSSAWLAMQDPESVACQLPSNCSLSLDYNKCSQETTTFSDSTASYGDGNEEATIESASSTGKINRLFAQKSLSTTTKNEVGKQTPDQFALHRKNQRSSVALCSLMDLNRDISPDTLKDDPKETYQAVGELTYNVNASTSIDKRHYRFNIIDTLRCDQGHLTFQPRYQKEDFVEVDHAKTSGFTLKELAQQQALTLLHPTTGIGYFKGKLLPNIFCPLTTHQSLLEKTMEIHCNPPDAVKLYWHPGYQQYYVKLTSNQSQTVEIIYTFQQNPNYAAKSYGLPVMRPKDELLPGEVISALDSLKDEVTNTSHPLSFLFTKDKNISEKLNLLDHYCRQFKEMTVESSAELTDLQKLLFNLLNQQGSCRHRSQAYMVLARYLGVPARLITNELHNFCETPYLTHVGAAWNWHMNELGGSPAIDITPVEKRENIFETTLNNAEFAKEFAKIYLNNEAHTNEYLDPETEEQKQKKLKKLKRLKKYQDVFIHLMEPKPFCSLKQMLKEQDVLPPLLALPKDVTPFAANHYFLKVLQENGYERKDYLYIHNASDLALYLSPYYLENGERKQKNGPLYQLIKNGGLLVINWSNFSPNEIASYKSLVDQPATLLNEELNKNVKVIGLTTANTDACSAFLSRCQPYKAQDAKLFSCPDNDIVIANNPIEIDLYHGLNWRQQLLGDIQFSGSHIQLKEGPLLKAIREKRPLIIHNSPKKDADFELLMHRLTVERRILCNGELMEVPAATLITQDEVAHENELPNVSIHTSGTFKNKKPIFIGLHNWHECFEQLKITKHHTAKNVPGYLEKYKRSKHYFYLSQSIPESDWQELLAKIKKEFPYKHFDFVLGKGVMIEKVIKSTSEFHLPESKTCVLVSNDHDHQTLQLSKTLKEKGKDTLIIDITPQTTFQQLMSKMKIKKGLVPGQFEFDYQPKKMLVDLVAGKHIILNGELSPTLYQQLLPLLHGDEPAIRNNGKKIKMCGQLYAVMPLEAKQHLPLQSCEQHHYSLKDYAANLHEEQLADYERLMKFYELAASLPAQGRGRPTFSQVSYQHVIQLLKKIKGGKLHPNNPIKGLFNYDYTKKSADYAYLNVIGKYLFGPRTKTEINLPKLTQLIKQHALKTPNDLFNCAWQILNCFNGEALIQLLGKSIDDSIDLSAVYPRLNEKTLLQLWQHITPYLQHDVIVTSKESVTKRTDQLNTLIEDPETPIIMLKGEPGTGKTYTVKKLKKKIHCEVYEGEDGIIKWLKTRPTQPCILLLDEANMAIPGTWDFLKGLSRENKTVTYKGVTYPLTPFHKVIATGNPEHFPERYYHPLLQHYAETLYFNMPDDDFLEKVILKKRLTAAGLYQNESTKAIITAYHLIQEFNPTYVYSTRDLKNVVERFIALMSCSKDQSDVTRHHQLWRALMAEFAFSIQDKNHRQPFMMALAKTFNIPLEDEVNKPATYLTKDCIIPGEKTLFLDAIEQDLLLRQRAVINKKAYYKRGILLEGDSGVGKSFLLKSLLEKHGFSKNAEDPQKKYYEISVSKDKNIAATLLKAFNEGAMVILDELNLDKSLEKLLNQLLTGTDLNGNKAMYQGQLQPGFMVLASQNPSYFKGRKSVSCALYNRMAMRYMDNYSDHGLQQIAKEKSMPHSKTFVQAYQTTKQRYPSMNTRTYHSAIHFYGANFANKKVKHPLPNILKKNRVH